MATVPMETAYDPLRPPGAVMVQRDGVEVVGHYGSVSAEIAVSTKAAGLIDRSGIRQLALTGPAAQLEHVLDCRRAGRRARRRRSRLRRRHVVLPQLRAASDRRRRAERHRALAPGREPGDLHRRARGDRRAAARVGGPLAGRARAAPASWRRPDCPRTWRSARSATAAWRAPRSRSCARTATTSCCCSSTVTRAPSGRRSCEAGHEHGLAPVGNVALELLQAAHRPPD